MRILVVEDNRSYGLVVVEHLMSHGFTVDLAVTAAEFRELSGAFSYDLFLVDLLLPDGDGRELTRELRARGIFSPVLIMTVKSDVKDRVKSLEAGADDYLVKPFSSAELMARILALLHRSKAPELETVQVGRLTCNVVSGGATWDGKSISLRRSEHCLLTLLARQSGRIVTRSVIDNALRRVSNPKSDNAIDQLVSRLRKALKDVGADIELRSVKRVGYVLKEAS